MTFDGVTLLADPVFGHGDAAFSMLDPNAPIDHVAGPVEVFHRRLTPLPDIDLDLVDAVVVSHLHPDHFDRLAQDILPEAVPLIVPGASTNDETVAKFKALKPLSWGTSHRITTPNGEIVITALPAKHSPDDGVAAQLGEGNGYWFELRQADAIRHVYWTGDTFAFPELRSELSARSRPDLLIAHVGGVGKGGPFGQISMDGAQLRDLADKLDPGRVLPIHHSTFEMFVEPIWEVAKTFHGSGHPLDLPDVGVALTYR